MQQSLTVLEMNKNNSASHGPQDIRWHPDDTAPGTATVPPRDKIVPSQFIFTGIETQAAELRGEAHVEGFA